MAEALEAQYKRGLIQARGAMFDDPREEYEPLDSSVRSKQGEQAWMRKMDLARRSARLAESTLRMSGRGDLANVFKDVGDIAEAGEGGDEDGASFSRKLGSNMAGTRASKIAQARGLQRSKAAAVGGGLSSALQGENAVGIAKGAASWYLLDVAFGALLTLVGFIPALLYLNFHYIMSKFGSKLFGELFFLQKLMLLFANIFAFVVIMVIFLWISIMIDAYTDPLSLVQTFGSIILEVFWGVIKGVVTSLVT